MSTPRIEPEFDALVGLVASSQNTGDRIYGCRMERKFVVAPAIAHALRETVRKHLALEQWVVGRKATVIHSIYFDTADFALYQRSIELGPAPSLKLRLRAYRDAATSHFPDRMSFLEAKFGVTAPDGIRLKRKARLGLNPKKTSSLLGVGTPKKPISKRKFWRPMLQYLAAHNIQPRLTVSYTREAYENTANQLRITFDTGYRAARLDENASPLHAAQGDLADRVVIEIKFVNDLPAWVLDSLARLGLSPDGQPFSKFKTAVSLLYPGVVSPKVEG